MDAVTYPDAQVIDFLEEYTVPVRVLISSEPLPQQFRVNWTPTFVILDMQGEEQHRSVGYLPPEEFIPMLIIGIAKSHISRKEYDRAIGFLDRLLAEYPKSDVAAEAIYYRGVSRYKATDNLKEMKLAYEKLQAQYKGSEWAKRASVYQKV